MVFQFSGKVQFCLFVSIHATIFQFMDVFVIFFKFWFNCIKKNQAYSKWLLRENLKSDYPFVSSRAVLIHPSCIQWSFSFMSRRRKKQTGFKSVLQSSSSWKQSLQKNDVSFPIFFLSLNMLTCAQKALYLSFIGHCSSAFFRYRYRYCYL